MIIKVPDVQVSDTTGDAMTGKARTNIKTIKDKFVNTNASNIKGKFLSRAFELL